MPQASARVSGDVDDGIEAYSDEHDVSRSDAIRELLQRGVEYDRVQNENERLRRQLQAVNARQEDVGELVEYVERERSLQERREERERERENAPVWTRARWFILGRSE
jgi:urease accessory protein UreF